ncbi:prolyl oligopeptidase family serine peptidase [Microbacterium telephonicum]|uniref:Dipeptidyl aminopeptidase/acylaminoacyl peptidase n=1 Tax=Microbacterium telephonicum TaxID=1714841 RepID=A0A498CMJ0_9MICO|nr:prolyl oligopeptidase family serine peptidase [Microbacterium telephonicum]RLK53011.1 dipeptidyl aminopeptidase/acylaminoacyl peptidase [Microbacterium telephonicum]
MAPLPYGSWPSPLSAAWAASASPRFEGAAFVGDEIWWGQSIPDEGGRTAVLRRRPDGSSDAVLPSPWNARSQVHEYGGGSWAATEDGRLFFVEKTDQRVWMLTPGGQPRALTPADGATRYGGLRWQHGVLLAISEHHGDGRVPRRAIVSIDDDGARELVAGSTFLAQPALSPDGSHLAWVAWNHPDMPWDRTELRVGRIEGGTVARWTAATSGRTAALQPEWLDAEALLYADDPDGRWNLFRLQVGDDLHHDAVSPADADTGGALWVLGPRWYAPLANGRIAAVRTDGADRLELIEPDGSSSALPVPPTARLLVEATDGERLLVSGAAPGGSGIWLVTPGEDTVPVAGGADTADAQWYPEARALTVDGAFGPVHAFDFPPTSPDHSGPDDELPPYLVFVHGGPTAHVGGVADSKIAYFTSRGIGVLDVNYGGSTGYGRAYRERLKGQWGVVDVLDVAAAASGLAAAGLADPERIAIEGGSAGGWTVLCALVDTDVFGAGISRYGVADLRALAADTHDFEARYLDGLVGPLPEAEVVYLERSPLTRPERLRTPLLIQQGADDAVVPPSQSEALRDALAARGVPHAYVLYEGEGHGFRRTETIVHALESELAFLGQVFGFPTPGVAPVPLD